MKKVVDREGIYCVHKVVCSLLWSLGQITNRLSQGFDSRQICGLEDYSAVRCQEVKVTLSNQRN